MQLKTKIWLIVAAAMILTGCILTGGAMNMLKWDFTKLGYGKYETKNYNIQDSFTNIAIHTNTANIKFVPSTDGIPSVECYEQAKVSHSVSVTDNTLLIKVTDTRKWYEYIGIHFNSPQITVFLPQGQYEHLTISTDTGNVEIDKAFSFENMNVSGNTGHITSFASAANVIQIQNTTGSVRMEHVSTASVNISVTTGKVILSDVICSGYLSVNISTGKTELTDIRCNNLSSTGSTGDIQLTNIVAESSLVLERSTGDIRLDGCDGTEILIETDTGDVIGSLLSGKVFHTSTDTGDVTVPNNTSGGICRITTDTGDIKITVN